MSAMIHQEATSVRCMGVCMEERSTNGLENGLALAAQMATPKLFHQRLPLSTPAAQLRERFHTHTGGLMISLRQCSKHGACWCFVCCDGLLTELMVAGWTSSFCSTLFKAISPKKNMFGISRKKRPAISGPSNFEHRVHTRVSSEEGKLIGLPVQVSWGGSREVWPLYRGFDWHLMINYRANLNS